MVYRNKHVIMIGFGLSLALFVGCGGSGNKDTVPAGGSMDVNNAANEDANNTAVAGYETRAGVLIETKSDGSKRAWVNDRSTVCLIYRLAQHPNTTILAGGTAHCENLEHAGITTWRLPTEDEAVYLMSHANEGSTRLIYPDDNPNCLFMATTSSVAGNDGRFVYTTNSSGQGAFNNVAVQGKLRTTAGIRCVAKQ